MNKDSLDTATFVASMRELADWYEAHPDFPMPTWDREIKVGLWSGEDVPKTKEQVAKLARQLKPVEKTASGSSFTLRKDFHGGAKRKIEAGYCGHSGCYQLIPVDRNDPAWKPCSASDWRHDVQTTSDHDVTGFGVSLSVSVQREAVCEKKVVGQRFVPPIPASSGHYEEVVEWECPDALLGDA